jgi:hypothetical protein
MAAKPRIAKLEAGRLITQRVVVRPLGRRRGLGDFHRCGSSFAHLELKGGHPTDRTGFLLWGTGKRLAEYIHQQSGGQKLPQSWRLSLRVGKNEGDEILCRHTWRNAGRR